MEYFNYKNINKKGYSIKDLLCKKLKLNDIKFNTLNDISELSLLFSKEIKYSNLCTIEKPSSNNKNIIIEEIIECIENDGGICTHINMIWGLLFTELGYDTKLVSCVENTENVYYKGLKYHMANIFKWNYDNNIYFFDIALGINNFYTPIDLKKESIIENHCDIVPKKYFRIINNNNNISNYIIQKIETINNNQQYLNLYEFNIDIDITWNKINETCSKYRDYCINVPLVYKLSKDGFLIYINETFSIITSNNTITTKINDKQQLENILKLYFNIDINRYSFFNNHKFKNKDTIKFYEINNK